MKVCYVRIGLRQLGRVGPPRVGGEILGNQADISYAGEPIALAEGGEVFTGSKGEADFGFGDFKKVAETFFHFRNVGFETGAGAFKAEANIIDGEFLSGDFLEKGF